MTSISANIEAIRQKIHAAAKAAGRNPATIKLIAVSKMQSIDMIRKALAAGIFCFGENYVQEAKAKYTGLRQEFPTLELHLIGPLQTNKAKEAVRLFDVIETLDRPKLAAALAAAMKKESKKPRLYVEVNIGNEPQKAGVSPEKLEDFLNLCCEEYGLNIEGLMCIPPEGDNPAPYFCKLKQLADKYGISNVSMGMSADFETAIRCGATDVRLGTAIFGNRRRA